MGFIIWLDNIKEKNSKLEEIFEEIKQCEALKDKGMKNMEEMVRDFESKMIKYNISEVEYREHGRENIWRNKI